MRNVQVRQYCHFDATQNILTLVNWEKSRVVVMQVVNSVLTGRHSLQSKVYDVSEEGKDRVTLNSPLYLKDVCFDV